ncbi:NAD(P)-binding Rossmann-fold superfamily protein [Abeliophyllum distichum]|uniref:Dihydroflavonol 4-reductase n=1 Tax=Abeliophyllum distichum TaxID=126358 RepID=A0ABD1PC57_9LAMI
MRTTGDPRKVEHLMALEGAPERLYLFEANLIEEGSFDSAVDGCDGIFHTASPVFLSLDDLQAEAAELIEPAVKGTLNVLRSCSKVSSIKRVVVTSSLSSVISTKNPQNPDVVIDEIWFSVMKQRCAHFLQWYPLSKTLAEEAARRFEDENGIDLVTMHPGFVFGPLLQPTLNLTSEAFVNLIKEGNEIWHNVVYRYVDVRDVAHTHILAFENPSASGRYCLVGSVIYSSEALKILNRLYPSLNLSANTTENQAATPPCQVSKERAKSLGLNFTPLEVSLKDTVENLKEKNILSF